MFINLEKAHAYLRGYFVLKKLVLNAGFKKSDIKIQKTQIWYGEFNQYEFKAKNSPTYNTKF